MYAPGKPHATRFRGRIPRIVTDRQSTRRQPPPLTGQSRASAGNPTPGKPTTKTKRQTRRREAAQAQQTQRAKPGNAAREERERPFSHKRHTSPIRGTEKPRASIQPVFCNLMGSVCFLWLKSSPSWLRFLCRFAAMIGLLNLSGAGINTARSCVSFRSSPAVAPSGCRRWRPAPGRRSGPCRRTPRRSSPRPAGPAPSARRHTTPRR
jgi:hypothetical protein